eukprot:3408605-Pyramimonas_sp.AAC.1
MGSRGFQPPSEAASAAFWGKGPPPVHGSGDSAPNLHGSLIHACAPPSSRSRNWGARSGPSS